MDALNLQNLPSEYDTIGKALLMLLSECPYIPSNVKLVYNNILDSECITLRTQGGTYRPDVVGGYTARVNFQIGYKSYPNSNIQSITAQNVADQIMKWLKDSSKPTLTGGRIITKIDISDCIPVVSNMENDKSVTYVASGVLNYEK